MSVKRFSESVRSIQPSATIRISDLARELRAEGVDVIDMGAGDVHFETPDHISTAAIDAINRGETHTTQANGLPELRDAIARKLTEDNGLRVDSDNIIVTPGSKQALFEAIFTLLNSGDKAVTLDPSWVSYKAIINLAGGVVDPITLDPASGFTPGGVDLGEHLDSDTELMVVNSPSNPAGAVFSRAELEEIRDLAIDHDFWVVTDEIYEKLIYGDSEHISIASLDGMADRTVTVNGFSKAYAMTGWRLGYFTAPPEVITQANKVHTQTVSVATTFVQHGGVAALQGPQDEVDAMCAEYEKRRTIIVDELEDAGFDFPAPEAAFYAFIPVEDDDDVELCESLLKEAHVAATPGSAFGIRGYIRLSFPMGTEEIREGVKRVAEYLK